MANPVVSGDVLMCTFGTSPSSINVLPVKFVKAEKKPMANIMDHAPMVNILPFGMCMSLSNPMVAAATAAALGVLTPQPCIPATASPWVPGCPTVKVAKMPALNSTSKCLCIYGGQISVTVPSAVLDTIP